MDQIRLFPRYFLSLLLRVLVCALAGVLLLTLVCMVPSAPMEANLEHSASVFAEEGSYPELFPWCTSQLDNFTDSLILMISGHGSGGSPLPQAMSASRDIISHVDSPGDVLAAHYGDRIPFDGEEPYYQYWHGYRLIIIPLLSLLDYSGIRILNGICQFLLTAALCLLLHRRGLSRLILPVLAALAMMMPLALAMSLQFSSCFYILLLSSIVLIYWGEALNPKIGIFFLYIGIATAFFDFLTYPLATLGIPAVFYFCICSSNIRDTFCRGVKICFSWAMGYVLMWASKWFLGSLILGHSILGVAGDALMERSSLQDGPLNNIWPALVSNIKYFLHTPAALILPVLAAVLLVLLLRSIRRGRTSLKETAVCCFPFVILALLPVAWYIVTSQHAVIHYWFTNKALAVSVFAGLAALAQSIHTKRDL